VRIDLAAWHSIGAFDMARCPIVFTPNIDHVGAAVEKSLCGLRID
jgi:hypothetical protein